MKPAVLFMVVMAVVAGVARAADDEMTTADEFELVKGETFVASERTDIIEGGVAAEKAAAPALPAEAGARFAEVDSSADAEASASAEAAHEAEMEVQTNKKRLRWPASPDHPAKGKGCWITQTHCVRHPGQYVGTFRDSWGEKNVGSGRDEAKCLARAQEYHVYCGNPHSVSTTAKYRNTQRMAHYPAVGCWIHQSTCNRDATWTGVFRDVWGEKKLGTANDEARCMQRAREYAVWCGNGKKHSTMAEFRGTGNTRYYPKAKGCFISQDLCVKHPSTVSPWPFRDLYGEKHVSAGSKEANCHARAREYHAWCGNPMSATTKAEFRPTLKVASYPANDKVQVGRRYKFAKASWTDAESHCKSKGKNLCMRSELCPNGFPARGRPVGDHWIAVRDMENGWVSVGTHFSERVCKLHQEIEGGRYGKPSWGFDQYNHPQICCDDPDEVVWAKTLALSESITWNDARDACKKDGLSLCPASVYCPEGPGKSPAGGITEGDHWAPSGDYPNSWVSVGSYDAARRVCRQHDALFGPPAWGTQPSTYAFKGHVRCCARDNACKSMPCANGSKCVAGKGDSYKCVCKKGFVGKDCAVENKCANGKKSPCKNGGLCESIGDAGGYRCDCKPGFSGKHCGKKDACSLSPCKNGADCKNDTTVKRGFKCACKPGFGGKTCARRDPCTSSPCKNGAKCVRDSATKFHCKCPAGFRGKRCGVNIDDCTPEAIKSCKNGGKCVDGINSYTCDCAGTKFAGPACTSYPMTGFVNVVGGTGELFIDDDQRNNDLGAKTVNVKSFALPGSTVEISAKLNPNGQTGIIASFKFRKATYTTGTDWECSVDGGKTYRRARAVQGRELPEGFDAQSPAKYIWVKNQNAKEVTCRMRLPMKHLASGTRIVLPVKNTIGPLCSRSNGASITYFYGEVCPNGGVQWNHMHTKNRRAGLKQSQCAWSRKAMKDNAAWLANWLGSCNEPPKMLFPKLPTSRASFYTKANVEEDSCKANPCASTATCKSSRFGPMPFKCTCNKGFTGDGKSCVEVDNCAKNPCDKNAKCRKTGPGKHECTCRKGFVGTGEKCEPLNNCKNAKSPCSPRATCTMTGPGQHKCACKTGYKGNGRHCKAINNCRLKNKPCHKHALCAPTGPGQHKCTCKKGRKGDGVKKCKSINPCKKGKGKGKGKGFGPCDKNAKCFHTGPNKYRCECAKGFKGNGKQCKEVNLCKSSKPCHGSATCTHTGPGKYTCQCLKGFDGDGKSCVEVDMCSRSKPCDANGLCSKTGPGTFKCACKEGFKGNGKVCKEVNICRSANPCDKNAKCKKTGPGVASCKCNKGYSGDGKACKAIDKCEKKPCDPNSVCESTGPGKFKCTCNKGFEAAGNSRTKCREVDACKKKPCDGHATCTATGPGTYKCACEKGFKGDGFSCAEINDCDTAGLCNENANCQKTGPGKHQCTCKAGFKGDGKHCSEMDVCAGNPCDKHATCSKGATPGNHVCKCANGYEGDGKTCTAVDNCKKKPCGDHSVCKATGAGTHTCSCEKGFRLKDGLCNAIRGCQERTAPAHATCVETGPGRLVFKCDAGYKWSRAAKGCVAVNGCDKKGACSADAACEATGPGTVKCTCKKGFDGDGKTCAKVDSCKSNPCGKGEACTSTGPGTHKCACAKGHRRSKANAAECVAVNNCADAKEAKKDICGKHGTCSYKGPGVHACTCNSGYARVSVPAKKLGEKPRAACVEKKGCASSPCSKFATCTEKGKGAYECKCNDKFVGDGVKCEVQPGFKAVTIAGKATIVPITTGDKHDTDLAIITERLSKLAVDDITPPTPTAAAPVAGAAPVKTANVMDRSGLKAATEKVLALETNTAQMLAQAKAETEALKALQKQSKQESDRLLKLMESRTDSILDAAVDATHAVLTHTPHPEGQHNAAAKKAESSATTVV